jgi:uncharacterized membrane protein
MAQADLLSTPRGTRVVAPHYDPDAFGRISEEIARFFGTARYLAIQTIAVVVWIIFNAVAVGLRFDPYPFILLNLMFSTQAAYAAPLILLAQNRQAERDRAEVERDRQVVARQIADTDFLARELSGIRIALEEKADREDIGDAVAQLTELLATVRGS